MSMESKSNGSKGFYDFKIELNCYMNQHAKFEIKGTILWIELFVKDEHINWPFDSKSDEALPNNAIFYNTFFFMRNARPGWFCGVTGFLLFTH